MTFNLAARDLLSSAMLTGMFTALVMPVMAQETSGDAEIEEIVTTGTRIQNENLISASQITTIGEEEIEFKQNANIERIFRDLPVTIPGDGENRNNGSAGQATIDLRGLGEGRSLMLIDGHRLAPYDINGQASADVIPTIMVERVDVITGGASAVYGSDAMSGAVNFIMRKDFEGFEIDYGWSETDSGRAVADGGESSTFINVMFGANFSDGRGNVTIGGGTTDRGAVLLGDREFGLFGVSTSTGAGLGSPPDAPSADCSGNSSFTTAHSSGVGSTTAIPATLNLRSGNSYQFRDDLTLVQGECARFNFNPFNYYQKPQERTNATTTARYEINDNVEVYARVSFSNNSSVSQIAPSGTFGQTFDIPVANPFFSAATRATIIDDLVAGAATFVTETNDRIAEIGALPAPTQDELDELAVLQAAIADDPTGFITNGINDQNDDGVFDENDSFLSTARRRTIELGPRTSIFKTNYTQYVLGLRGTLPGDAENWNWHASYNYGESEFIDTRDGFTNLTNLAAAIQTVDADQCIDIDGNVTAAPCTPINVFGPEGSITQEQRDSGFFIALASDIRKATQTIWSGSVDGEIEQFSLPWADDGLSLAFGLEFAEISARSDPDECLKLPPASCQGGAGGNRLPIAGTYSADEYFAEFYLPLVQGRSGAESVAVEAGYRDSDYDIQGGVDAWKAGISWEAFPGLRFRIMQQATTRVANIGELFSPKTTGLDNATFDPCSIGNPNPPEPGSELFQRCVETGMLPSQVGTVPDIISGQINVFNGTEPTLLPKPEEGTSTTIGAVWQPEFGMFENLMPTTISLDWYDIEIEDYIDEPSGQEALDICYVVGNQACLDGVVRVGGAITVSGTGIPAFVRNFEFRRAEGIDLGINSGFDLGQRGELSVQYVGHKYLTNEFKTTTASPVVDCNGFYGTSCRPVPEYRHTLRTSWYMDEYTASLLWRHVGSMELQTNERESVFEAFHSVDAANYLDLTLGYTWRDTINFSLLVTNLLDEDPQIVGDDTAPTDTNSGGTFPSLWDTMGRVYFANVRLSFGGE